MGNVACVRSAVAAILLQSNYRFSLVTMQSTLAHHWVSLLSAMLIGNSLCIAFLCSSCALNLFPFIESEGRGPLDIGLAASASELVKTLLRL